MCFESWQNGPDLPGNNLDHHKDDNPFWVLTYQQMTISNFQLYNYTSISKVGKKVGIVVQNNLLRKL